jgi:hypothetical protein
MRYIFQQVLGTSKFFLYDYLTGEIKPCIVDTPNTFVFGKPAYGTGAMPASSIQLSATKFFVLSLTSELKPAA